MKVRGVFAFLIGLLSITSNVDLLQFKFTLLQFTFAFLNTV